MNRREDWEMARSKGFMRFVLEIGILRFGIPVVLIMKTIDCFYTYFLQNATSSHFSRDGGSNTLIGMLIEGVFFGVFFWIYGEYKFRKLLP